ncbi:hypothetical protein PMAYCL1PPCAC_32343, partial [Pristionchus mayeri]
GRGKRKRRLTEAAEAAQAQARPRLSSRRISERKDQHLSALEYMHEELTEPIEEEVDGEESEIFHPTIFTSILTEVAHEEMVHADSPQGMYMQSHLRSIHSMGGQRVTRGMHIVSDHDDLLDQELVEEHDIVFRCVRWSCKDSTIRTID